VAEAPSGEGQEGEGEEVAELVGELGREMRGWEGGVEGVVQPDHRREVSWGLGRVGGLSPESHGRNL
jgi:hypothetical protein